MKRTLLIAGLAAVAIFAAVEYEALFESEDLLPASRRELQSRAERLAEVQETLRFMEAYELPGQKGLCGTAYLQASLDVRAAIEEGLLPPDTHIPKLSITVLQR